MSRLSEMIKELCPDGVEFVPLWSVTIWDKKFNAVERYKQPVVDSYQYLLANDLFLMEVDCGDVFLLSTGEKTGWTTEAVAGEYLKEGEVVSIPWGKSRAVTDCIKYYKGKFVTADNRIATSSNTKLLSNKYLYYWMMSQGQVIDSFYRGSGIKHPDMAKVLDMQIPLPPLPIQNEIVKLLDNFTELTAELTAELTLRKKQYSFYRDSLLNFSQDASSVEWKTLREISAHICSGGTPRKTNSAYYNGGTIPWLRTQEVAFNYIEKATSFITEEGLKNSSAKWIPAHCVIVAISGATAARSAVNNIPITTNQHCCNFEINDKVADYKYVFYWVKSQYEQIKGLGRGARADLNADIIGSYPIPIPPLEVQQKIVSILDRFDALTSDITQGLPAEIAARKKQYEYYRDKLLTFPRKAV